MGEEKKRRLRNRGSGEVEYGEEPSYAKEIGNIFSRSMQNALDRETRRQRTKRVAPFMTTTPTGRLFDYESLTLSQLARLGIPATKAKYYLPEQQNSSGATKKKKKKKKKGKKSASRETSSTGGERSTNYITVPSVGTTSASRSRLTSPSDHTKSNVESNLPQRTSRRNNKVQNVTVHCLSKLDQQRTKEDQEMASFHREMYGDAPPVKYSSPFKRDLNSKLRQPVQSTNRPGKRSKSCPARKSVSAPASSATNSAVQKRKRRLSAGASLGRQHAASHPSSGKALGIHSRRSSRTSDSPYSYSASHHVRVHSPVLFDRRQINEDKADSQPRYSPEADTAQGNLDIVSSGPELLQSNEGKETGDNEWHRLLETYRQRRSHIGRYESDEKYKPSTSSSQNTENVRQLDGTSEGSVQRPERTMSTALSRKQYADNLSESENGDGGTSETDRAVMGGMEEMLRATKYQDISSEDTPTVYDDGDRFDDRSLVGNHIDLVARDEDEKLIGSSNPDNRSPWRYIEYDSPPHRFRQRSSSPPPKDVEKKYPKGTKELGDDREERTNHDDAPTKTDLERMLRIATYQNDKIEDISSLLSHEHPVSNCSNRNYMEERWSRGAFTSTSFRASTQHENADSSSFQDRIKRLSSSLDSLEDTYSALQYAVDNHSMETNKVARGLPIGGVSQNYGDMSDLLSSVGSSNPGAFRKSEMVSNGSSYSGTRRVHSGSITHQRDTEAHLASLGYGISSALSPLQYHDRSTMAFSG